MKKVSVIVPVYNVEKYISDCIRSIVNQDYSNLEIIIVDDGSTDGSLKICKKYAETDSRIKFFHKQNEGAGAARNFGIDCATSDFITFVDGDDILESDYVSSLVAQQEKFNSDVAITFYKNFYDNEYFLIMNPVPGDTKYDGVYFPIKLLGILSFTAPIEDSVPWNKLYKKSLFDNIRYPEHFTICEDSYTTWRLILLARQVSFENIITYNYRSQRKDSIMAANSNCDKYYEIIKTLEEKITITTEARLDASYTYGFYNECLEQLYDIALKAGNFDAFKSAAFKLQMINKYRNRKKNN